MSAALLKSDGISEHFDALGSKEIENVHRNHFVFARVAFP